MLRRENELRLCQETQNKFKSVASSKGPSGWLDVVEELQRQVCREFAMNEKVGLVALRYAQDLLPGDIEVHEISLYRKYNRCRDGKLQVADAPPDVTLLSLNSNKERQSIVSIRELLLPATAPSQLPLVVFAGSYT